MKNTNLSEKVSSRALRSGGYSILITVIVLAALIILNLLVGSLPASFTKPDMTAKKMLTLDAQTLKVVNGIDEDITVYLIAEKGSENALLTGLLDRYESASRRIKVKTVDPAVSPAFISKYTDDSLASNSLIVESAKRSKVIPYSDIMYTDYSNITEEEYYQYMYYGIQPRGESVFAGENAVTSALDFVTASDIPVIYALTGHGETSLSSRMQEYIKDENYELSEISLLSTSSPLGGSASFSGSLEGLEVNVPEDADCIIINAPQSDISSEEKDALLKFAAEGGKLVVTADYTVFSLENMKELASGLGLDLCGSLVVETSGHYYQRAYYLLPDAVSHEITDPLISNKSYMLFASSHAMKKSVALPENVSSVTELVKSTDEAYAKGSTDFENIAFSDGDVKGPFILAALSQIGEGEAVWFASSYITDDGADSLVSGGNSNLFLNTLGHLCEKTSSVTVRTITMTIEPLVISDSSSTVWMIILAILVPVLTLAAGLVIWLRRRSK